MIFWTVRESKMNVWARIESGDTDRMETNSCSSSLRERVWQRIDSTDKLLFSSWSEPPTSFAYRHHSLSGVRLGRVVSCVVPFVTLYPPRFDFAHTHALVIITR